MLATASLLFCKHPVLSQSFFFLNPENFKNPKVFQVFKGLDEKNIGPNWVIRLETKGLLSFCLNQLEWRRGKGGELNFNS